MSNDFLPIGFPSYPVYPPADKIAYLIGQRMEDNEPTELPSDLELALIESENTGRKTDVFTRIPTGVTRLYEIGTGNIYYIHQ